MMYVACKELVGKLQLLLVDEVDEDPSIAIAYRFTHNTVNRTEFQHTFQHIIQHIIQILIKGVRHKASPGAAVQRAEAAMAMAMAMENLEPGASGSATCTLAPPRW
jgi:hypothetical protein